MRLIGTIIACCLIIAAAKAIAIILVLSCILMLVWGAVTSPASTLSFVIFCLIVSLADRYPGWCLGLAAVCALRFMTRPRIPIDE